MLHRIRTERKERATPGRMKGRTMSRRTRWFLALFTLTALGVTAFWLHHTRIAIGWWRGEAFYKGRPTSYWREELALYSRIPQERPGVPVEGRWTRGQTFFERQLSNLGLSNTVSSFVLDDSDAVGVLAELLNDPDDDIRALAGQCLRLVEQRQKDH